MKARIVRLGGVALATAIGFATLGTMVHAQTDIIKQRQETMKAQGGAMKAINAILEANGPVADIAQHAAVIEGTSKKVPDLFPAGSDQGETKAKAEIWQDPEDFATKVKDLQDQAAMLVTAVAGGDMAAVKAQYDKLGGACGGCHKIYKAK